MYLIRGVFALKYEFSLIELERVLVNVGAYQKKHDGVNACALAAGFRWNLGRRHGRPGDRHNGRDGPRGRRGGRHDGR